MNYETLLTFYFCAVALLFLMLGMLLGFEYGINHVVEQCTVAGAMDIADFSYLCTMQLEAVNHD